MEKYIESQLDFKGGGCYFKNALGLYQIGYCYRATSFQILKVNIKLFIMWLLGRR